MIRSNRIASFAVTALAAAGLGAAALVGAGTAAASTADVAFLEDVSSIGITYDAAEDAVYDGQLVCQRLDEGTDPVDVLNDYSASSPELTVKQAKAFILAAAGAYCPEHL